MRLALLCILVGLLIFARVGTTDAVAMKTWPSAGEQGPTKGGLNRYFLTTWRKNITSEGKRVVPTGPNPLHNRILELHSSFPCGSECRFPLARATSRLRAFFKNALLLKVVTFQLTH
ncbi:hypothetical protein QQP08_025250 [Theobroma cacao]|nr:hypothetical protein QQP08_024868 [Theobroma cacao]WRX32763.1 hypothetical protein QQP08_025250 [Theobroma cacao]